MEKKLTNERELTSVCNFQSLKGGFEGASELLLPTRLFGGEELLLSKNGKRMIILISTGVTHSV